MSTKRPLTNDQLVKAAITTKRVLQGFSDMLRPRGGRPLMLLWFAEDEEGCQICAPRVPDPDGRLLRMQIHHLRTALAQLEAGGWSGSRVESTTPVEETAEDRIRSAG